MIISYEYKSLTRVTINIIKSEIDNFPPTDMD